MTDTELRKIARIIVTGVKNAARNDADSAVTILEIRPINRNEQISIGDLMDCIEVEAKKLLR